MPMTDDVATKYVSELYTHLLKRQPQPTELAYWVGKARDTEAPQDIFFLFLDSKEFRDKSRVSPAYPVGHYYSPVVDPQTVGAYVQRTHRNGIDDLHGIDIPIEAMREFWNRQRETIRATPFTEEPDGTRRFYYNNNIFPYGDAISLRAMLADLRPRRVIEIGSGFSSACMLDSADEFALDTRFTFIDPYADRLRSVLRQSDLGRVDILEQAVQETALELYAELAAGDILFIDSTHVLKTGSDVHFELFSILPALAPGVRVHFHDIQFPFEYPGAWIFDKNYSWNEIYALRAFLMYNEKFAVQFWGSCFARTCPNLIQDTIPVFLKNPGGSLWVAKTG